MWLRLSDVTQRDDIIWQRYTTGDKLRLGNVWHFHFWNSWLMTIKLFAAFPFFCKGAISETAMNLIRFHPTHLIIVWLVSIASAALSLCVFIFRQNTWWSFKQAQHDPMVEKKTTKKTRLSSFRSRFHQHEAALWIQNNDSAASGILLAEKENWGLTCALSLLDLSCFIYKINHCL